MVLNQNEGPGKKKVEDLVLFNFLKETLQREKNIRKLDTQDQFS